MNGIDLDTLRAGWSSHQQELDASLRLDAQTLRATLLQRTGAAFRRHRGWLLASLLGASVCFSALMAFIVTHADDSIYRLLATPLAMLALAELIVDWRQWRALSRLDLDAPLLHVQAVLDELRGRVLRLAKWVVVWSVLLWLPLVLVLFKGLIGVDLLDHLHPSVIYVNLLVGLLFVPIALWVMRWVSSRYRQRPGFERFLDDVAGSSFGKAREQFDAQRKFNLALDSGDARSAMADRADPILLAALHKPLRSLKRRLLLALSVYLALLLATGACNIVHGGEPQFLIPTLLLHFTWLAHLLLAVLQRNRVARWRSSGSIDELRALMKSIIKERQRAERWTLSAAPLLLAAGSQVLAKVLVGMNLMALMTPASMALLALLVVVATLSLSLRRPGHAGRIHSAAANAISLGVRVAALRLRKLLGRG